MFDAFVKSFRSVIDKFLGNPLPKSLDETLENLKIALIESDVDAKLAGEIINNIRERIKKDKRNIAFSDKFIDALYNELHSIIGGNAIPSITTIPYKILLVGLFGSGKTTTAGKLALFYKKRGFRVLLVGLDIHRPAASEQIKQIAEQVGVKYIVGDDIDKIIEQEKKIEKQFDIIIFDTAGRSSVDSELIEEIKQIKSKVQPTNVMLIISADIGQNARSQVQAFHDALGINSIIITKTDTSARGGGALIATYLSKAKIAFVGEGEKLNALSEFDEDAFIKRLIGIDRLGELLDKIKQEDIKINEESAKRIIKNEFNLIDFYEQLKTTSQIGASNIIETLGLKSKEDLDSKFKDFQVIMQSMTWEELNNPEILDKSRIMRIAKGSGKSEEEVRQLVALYNNTKKIMKMVNNRNLSKWLSKFGFKI